MMKFTESHEWIAEEKDIGCVGITRQAQKELGEVVHVELPIIGKKVVAGEEVAVLESTKAAADIYSPVSGEIVAINQMLTDSSDLINTDPEGTGWLFKIHCSNLAEVEDLLNKREYLALIE
ncbi:MAG: glycine cleavage system protein GcvH [Chlamydiales bacterium]